MFCSEDSLFGSRGWCRGWGDPSGVHGVTHIFRNTQSAIYNWYIQCSAHATTYMKNILTEGLAQVQTWRWDRAVLSFTIAHFRGPAPAIFTPSLFILRLTPEQEFARILPNIGKNIGANSEKVSSCMRSKKNSRTFPVSKKLTSSLSVLHINPLNKRH